MRQVSARSSSLLLTQPVGGEVGGGSDLSPSAPNVCSSIPATPLRPSAQPISKIAACWGHSLSAVNHRRPPWAGVQLECPILLGMELFERAVCVVCACIADQSVLAGRWAGARVLVVEMAVCAPARGVLIRWGCHHQRVVSGGLTIKLDSGCSTV